MNLEESDTKREVIEKLLEEGMVLITLDSRATGVRVPSHLGGDPQLRLNLSYRFGLPMETDADGISATLTFAGEPFACRIPWETIYLAMSHATGQPVLFPADIPADGGDDVSGLKRIDEPSLRVVTTPSLAASNVASDDTESTDGPADSAQQQKRSRRGHLRVVK